METWTPNKVISWFQVCLGTSLFHSWVKDYRVHILSLRILQNYEQHMKDNISKVEQK